jgi:hypothetical protein
MAYENPDVFGEFNLYTKVDNREIGKYGREILVLAEASGGGESVHAKYLNALGVLCAQGAEVGRACVIHSRAGKPQTVGAEHVFYFPRDEHEGTVLGSMEGDNEGLETPDGVYAKFDRKTSMVPLGPMGELALQYDGLAEPPVLRVIDLQGHREDGCGDPKSELPVGMLSDLLAATTD